MQPQMFSFLKQNMMVKHAVCFHSFLLMKATWAWRKQSFSVCVPGNTNTFMWKSSKMYNSAYPHLYYCISFPPIYKRQKITVIHKVCHEAMHKETTTDITYFILRYMHILPEQCKWKSYPLKRLQLKCNWPDKNVDFSLLKVKHLE